MCCVRRRHMLLALVGKLGEGGLRKWGFVIMWFNRPLLPVGLRDMCVVSQTALLLGLAGELWAGGSEAT